MNPGDKKALVIARRSRKNLDFIYSQKQQGADVEEFTQLLNSMLGMLVCLREEYFRGEEVTWKRVEEYGLKPIRIEGDAPSKLSPNLKQSKTFSRLISNLRHAFAHNCFELVGNPITGVKVWNVPAGNENKCKNRNWQANLSEEQLREVATLFIDFLEKKHGQDLPANAI
ncbi:MAG: HEPN family nuclease [Planctomycetota bacterium]|jgi:hypothetical protein